MSDSCGRQDKSSLPPSLRASLPDPPGCEPQEREAWWVRRGPASGEGRGMVEFAKSLLSAKRGNRKSVLFPLAGKGHSERLSIAGGPGRRRLACKPAVCKTRKTPRSPETGVTRSKSRKGCRRCRSACGDPATARDRRRRGPRLAKGQRASHARPPQAQGRGGHPARSQRLAPGPAGRIRLIAAARPRLSRTACRPSDRRRKRHLLKGKRPRRLVEGPPRCPNPGPRPVSSFSPSLT